MILKKEISTLQFKKKKKEFFLSHSILDQKELLLHSNPNVQEELLKEIPINNLLQIFKFLDPDEVTDLIQTLDKKKQHKIINSLSKNLKNNVDFLNSFSPTTAAGRMNLNYILIQHNSSKQEIKDRIQKHIYQGKKEPTLLVTDKFGHLLGELKYSSILFSKTNKEVYDNLYQVPTVSQEKSQQECLDLIHKHSHEKIAVLDNSGLVVGIIKAKHLLKAVEQESQEDYYALAGLHKQEEITDKPLEKVHYRLTWLVINLFTAFLAALVVALFESTISKYVLLAAFMPIVAGMGGNAGTQTTAILIRSLALGKVNGSIGKIVKYELIAGLINGVFLGLLVGSIAKLLGEPIIFGLVAGLAVLGNLFIAALFGTLFPIILEKFGIDPATASNVFVTTTTDVLGFLIFLGLASILLI